MQQVYEQLYAIKVNDNSSLTNIISIIDDVVIRMIPGLSTAPHRDGVSYWTLSRNETMIMDI